VKLKLKQILSSLKKKSSYYWLFVLVLVNPRANQPVQKKFSAGTKENLDSLVAACALLLLFFKLGKLFDQYFSSLYCC